MERVKSAEYTEADSVKAAVKPRDDIFATLRDMAHREAILRLNKKQDELSEEELLSLISDVVDGLGGDVPRPDRIRIVKEIYNEINGLGPLEELLGDNTVSEIMVNGPERVYVERKGKLTSTDVSFRDNNHIMNIIDRIVSPLGRHIDEANPMVDARLPDGSRVNAIIPPLALCGPTLTIRKFSAAPLTVGDLIRFGSLSHKIARFLEACVKGRLNILVSGGTGSGKTTLLNVLSSFIPADERIVTIEDAAELRLMQEHVVPLESRPSNTEGRGEITIRDLVKNALRMRPDRIVVGEVRGGEALDMLQAMNTGHDGSITTAHANNPRDALARIETMVLMAGMQLPIGAIRRQVASALDIIIQQSRLRDGSRKIISVCEVLGMEGDIITMQEIFSYKNDGGRDSSSGAFIPSGVKPKCCEKINGNGVSVSDDWFIN
jgi:pilus assembly protein CpaF